MIMTDMIDIGGDILGIAVNSLSLHFGDCITFIRQVKKCMTPLVNFNPLLFIFFTMCFHGFC